MPSTVPYLLAALAAAASAGPAPARAAPPPAFAACAGCHPVSADRMHGMGPNLRGVVGRKAGAAAGFAGYSPALKRSGITWSAAELDAFLADPGRRLPNTSMIFPGVPKAADRAAIIAHLQSLR